MASATATDTHTVLAFDFGTRRIGVAVGNSITAVARPLTAIASDANAVRFAAIETLIDEWRPGMLVVGQPVHGDGTPHEMTARALRFARQLEGRFGMKVVCVDERYTTEGADDVLTAAGVPFRARKAVRDGVAAQLILQSWFDDAARSPADGPA